MALNHSLERKKFAFFHHSFMEESGNNETPICNLIQDHLFSILLLLPINSILSFALTCKKFNSLASSDTLWESICRREWGPTCVDALKSSYFNGGNYMPWMKLYHQVTQLGSVSCLKLIDPLSHNMLPCPRASHSLNFVSNCLVLFGGGCEGGRHLDDTWVALLGYDFKTILKWQKVTSGLPSGRFVHTCVVTGDFLILFGGINDHGIRQNDTWIGRIVHSETFGITLFWRLLDVGSVAPPPRGAHAGCSMENRRMLIHGGIGPDGVRLGDLWILEISENFCHGTWYEIVTHPAPPPRSGHTLTCIDGTRTLLFGGRGLGYDVLDDVWVFDATEGHSQWVRVQVDLSSTPWGNNLPRVGHSATLILGGKVLIYGGENSQRQRKNDFWLFDVNSIKKHPFSTRMWRRLKSCGYKPKGRSFHAACSDHSGRLVYTFGGMADESLQPAESSGLQFDADVFAVELLLDP
ncbi:hypothetical protein BVRB_7g177570 [Beta vulgaris subsp. vulgaris]|uniref:F-box domain-containing protein n=2 Tax=Beta vulgaris subsp. vulgaris TaxID=3555 RepID=A0A0J8E266_BETVV|nr:hypothetical protein BVRB_7g177570 [Beta vulgaris subsp. vulgaris]